MVRYLNKALNSRARKIAEILLQANEYFTVTKIAKITGCTPRMVRYQLDNVRLWMERNGAQLRHDKMKGLCVKADRDVKDRLLSSLSKGDGIKNKFSPDERQRILARLFLLNSDSHYTINHIMEQMGASRSTVLRDIDEFNQMLSKYGLQVAVTRGKGYYLLGNEKNLRQVIADIILNTQPESELLADLFNQKDLIDSKSEGRMTEYLLWLLEKRDGPGRIDFLLREITRLESKLDTRFTDTGRVALLIHLAIAINRLESGKPIKMAPEQLSNLSSMPEFQIAREFAMAVGRQFHIDIPEDEVGYITLRLIGARKVLAEIPLSNSRAMSSFMIDLSLEIVTEAEIILGRKFVDDELVKGLATHLSPAYYRVIYGLLIRNPFLEELKVKYPSVFQAASEACQVFTRRTGVSLPEEENAYVAMHIGAALERAEKKEFRKKRIAIVCASGVGTANILSAQVESQFPTAEVIGVYPVSQVVNGFDRNVDAVISTIPLKLKNIPCAVVSPILRFEDIRLIDSLLNLIPSIPQETIRSVPAGLKLRREHIRFNVHCDDWIDSVRIAGNILVKGGFCEKRYVNAMIRQIETHGSYVVLQGGLALPHATPRDGVKKPGISLIRLKAPVKFPGRDVDVWAVMGLALTGRIGPREMASLKQLLFEGEPERIAKACTVTDLMSSLSSIIE